MRTCCSTLPPSVGTQPTTQRRNRANAMPGSQSSAGMQSRTDCPCSHAIAPDTSLPRTLAAASNSGDRASSPGRRANCSRKRRRTSRNCSSPTSTSRAAKLCAASGRSCAIGASMPTATCSNVSVTEMDVSTTEPALAGQPHARATRDGVEYTLLGTAHFSRASVDAVRAAIETGSYDAIAVELCESRYRAMHDPEAWRNLDLWRVIRDGKAGMVAANLALSAYQRRLAEQFGIEPGAELKAAADMAAQR